MALSQTTTIEPTAIVVSVTSRTDSFIANTLTGTVISSFGPTTRGIVGRIISGWRTNTDFSVDPKAAGVPALLPATTITRTAPT